MVELSEVAVFALLYGNHHNLHRRLIESLEPQLQPGMCTLWCNQVCDETRLLLQSKNKFSVVGSQANIPKYEAMRALFSPLKSQDHIKWICWFDDDSHVVKQDWLERTLAYIDTKALERICYIGQPWYVHHLPGQKEFIEAAPWYHGKPFQQFKGKPGIQFATGGYFWLKVDAMKRLDWPDTRLSHNGGDTLLGEAIYQQGLPFHKWDYGVKVNDAPRRGRSDRPAGSTVETRR